MLEKLRESLINSPIIKRGEYEYFIHPITDGIPLLDPDLMDEICDHIIETTDLDIDYIMTIESMGIHIATCVSQKTGLPVKIVRKKQYWLEDEVVLDQKTGYSSGKLFMNYVKSGDIVTVIDSVISTGGTLITVLNGLKDRGALVKDIVCVIERGDGVDKVKNETGFDVKTLVKIEVDGKLRIIE